MENDWLDRVKRAEEAGPLIAVGMMPTIAPELHRQVHELLRSHGLGSLDIELDDGAQMLGAFDRFVGGVLMVGLSEGRRLDPPDYRGVLEALRVAERPVFASIPSAARLERLARRVEPAKEMSPWRDRFHAYAQDFREQAVRLGAHIDDFDGNEGLLDRLAKWIDEHRERFAAGIDATTGGDPRVRVARWMLSDDPVTTSWQDALEFGHYAEALHGMINDPLTSTPLVMAINAPWGAGKTSLGRMVERRLRENPSAQGTEPHVTCWFNAWMHDDAEALAGALCAMVARVADQGRSWWQRVARPVPSAILSARARWKRRVRCIVAWAAVALVASIGIVVLGTLNSAEGLDGVTASVMAAFKQQEAGEFLGRTFGPTGLVLGVLWFLVNGLLTWRTSLMRFITDPRATAAAASIGEVRDHLARLIDEGTPEGSRFIIFVDDIERCRPPKSVDLLEAVNQLLSHPRVIVVLMGDMPAVAANVDIKYSQLARRHDPSIRRASAHPRGRVSAYGRLYLQKIVQLQFDLPPQPPGLIRKMLVDLAAGRQPKAKPAPVGEERPARKLGDWITGLERGRVWAKRLISSGFVLAIGGAGASAGLDGQSGIGPLVTVLGVVSMSGFITIGVGGLAYATLFAVIAGLERIKLRRLARQRGEARKYVEEVADATPEVLYDPKARVRDRKIDHEVFEEQRRMFITADSPLVEAAFGTALEHMPRHPRSAKRLLGRLRLLILLAYARGILAETPDGEPVIGYEHIGKWAVLNENWPELGQALRLGYEALKPADKTRSEATGETQEEAGAAETEEVRETTILTETVRQLVPQYAGDADLITFLQSKPSLLPVLERLVLMTPGNKDNGGSGSPR